MAKNQVGNLLRKLYIFPILFYKKCISPFLPNVCRYYPSCSSYAIEAIQIHGIFHGTWLAICRICRCNPYFEGGFDPVPPKKDKATCSENKIPL